MPKRRPRKTELYTFQFRDSCEHKSRYKNKEDALEAAEFRMLENMNIELGVYECPICLGWHLTSLNKESEH